MSHTDLLALTYELGAAPDERQKLEVVQTPNTLTPGRLHPVGLLQLPHHLQIPANTARTLLRCLHEERFCLDSEMNSPVEHLEDDGQLIVHPERSDLTEAAEERCESCFVT